VSVLHQGTDANFVCFFFGHVALSLSALIMPGEVGIVKDYFVIRQQPLEWPNVDQR
jgi:hypothetical protein